MLYNPIFGTLTATMLRRQLRANDYRHCGNLPYNVVFIYSIGESQYEKARNGAGI